MTIEELIKRRLRLAMQSDIPDMNAYAEEWRTLGDLFAASGFLANAAICNSNWKRYGGIK